MIERLRELLQQIYNVRGLVQWGGTALVCAIVFVETGLFVGFFLPGDSLLVTAGIFSAAGHLQLRWLLGLVTLCAIAGDQLGYWIGRTAGERLYQREDSRFFKRRHLERAHTFYSKNGGKTVILARFIPIVRTFCPPVAGAAGMPYFAYLFFDVLGGLCWVWSMVLAGYFLASAVPHIDRQIHWVVAIVIFLSLLPPIIHTLRSRRGSPPATTSDKQ